MEKLGSIKAVVVHSGGMDSSLCLALACKEFGAEHILSLSFIYGQRHATELKASKEISDYFKVQHKEVSLSALQSLTDNALVNHAQTIENSHDNGPTTLVTARNGIMAMLAGAHAHDLGAQVIYLGVIGVDSDNSGYRDCSREYMDLIESTLKIDTNNQNFEIRTPLVEMTKLETMKLADSLHVLEFLLDHSVSCYEGIQGFGCGQCPACLLRNAGVQDYLEINPNLKFSYRNKFK